MPTSQRTKLLQSLTEEEKAYLAYWWPYWARDSQLAPDGDWSFWLFLGGRGSGKTRAGAEWVRGLAEKNPGWRIAMVAPTHADLWRVLIEGDSGLLSVCPPDNFPKYDKTDMVLTWPNGAKVFGFSAEKPERLRGPQFHAAWTDEIAGWHHGRRQATWDMLQFGLRLGRNPQTLVTTTPVLCELLTTLIDEAKDGNPAYKITTGSTYDNRSNLAAGFFRAIISKYEGTKLGKQELEGTLIREIEGALFKMESIRNVKETPDLQRIVVAVDPSGSKSGDEAGIVAAGIADDTYYVIADRSAQASPSEWARAAIALYDEVQADQLVWEANFGKDMVAATLVSAAREMYRRGERPTESINHTSVTAFRGKVLRAEPVAALYEQGKVRHLGKLSGLEDEMVQFTYKWDRDQHGSPGRLDANVMAITELQKRASGSQSLVIASGSTPLRPRRAT